MPFPPIRDLPEWPVVRIAAFLIEAHAMGPAKARVLALLASGITCTKDLSEKSGIPPKWVDDHVSELMRAGRFASRGDLAVAAARFVLCACPTLLREGGGIIRGEGFPG